MRVLIRKIVKDYITNNGASAKSDLVNACITAGAEADRTNNVIDKMITRGKLVESGGTYTVAA